MHGPSVTGWMAIIAFAAAACFVWGYFLGRMIERAKWRPLCRCDEPEALDCCRGEDLPCGCPCHGPTFGRLP